jgi:Protein of unknown function (DUF664)
MTWTAPDAQRTDPPWVATERAALHGWLDYHRATLLTKCAGLDGEQLARRAAEPSSLSLLGLVRHTTDGRRGLDLRWIYLHMIEEYARHNGHADLLRERIDGVTGD